MILGTAVGDSLGLPAEGISKERAGRMFKGRRRQLFILGRGMISDDTEHCLFVVQSILAHPDSHERFARRLGLCLKWWFAALPAGVGLATARACICLWIGFDPKDSGVFSAGNGPAMRAAPLGAFFFSKPEDLDAYVRVSTCITHTDPKALTGALAVARTAAWIVRDNLPEKPDIGAFCRMLRDISSDDSDWRSVMETMEEALQSGKEVHEFASAIGCGKAVSGYIYHTVPAALFAWHRHFGDFEKTLASLLDCGGDTDTTGAIAGALAGLSAGENGIPKDWVEGIVEWPRSVRILRMAADRMAELAECGKSAGPVKYFLPGILPRNLLFLAVVLAHGFRRLLPPY